MATLTMIVAIHWHEIDPLASAIQLSSSTIFWLISSGSLSSLRSSQKLRTWHLSFQRSLFFFTGCTGCASFGVVAVSIRFFYCNAAGLGWVEVCLVLKCGVVGLRWWGFQFDFEFGNGWFVVAQDIAWSVVETSSPTLSCFLCLACFTVTFTHAS